MKTNSHRQHRPETPVGPRRAGWAPLAALVVAGAAGCGGNSGNADVDEFLGTWLVDSEASTFTLTCPFLADPLPFQLWSVLRLEPGTLSDLVDLGGPCPGYYDVTQKGVANLASPDPFTGQAPICRIDESTDSVTAFLELQFADWKLLHLAPVKGKAPQGQLAGSANAPFFTVDSTGQATADPEGACTFVVNAQLSKISEK